MLVGAELQIAAAAGKGVAVKLRIAERTAH
jgi:hypothetical protein